MNPSTAKGLRSSLQALLLAGFGLSTAGCLSPEAAVAEVDAEAGEAIGEKQDQLFGRRDPVDPATPEGRVAATAIEDGLARKDATVHLTIQDILERAAKNSREFQSAKETLYRAVLSLMRQRENFRASPFGVISGDVTRSGGEVSVGTGSEFGVTNIIQRGGSYALSMGLDFLRFVTSPTSESADSFLNLVISLPLLRNAELNTLRENLTQADRELLYALRDFERFKQTYGVQVLSAYLRVLSQRQRLGNEEANLRRLTYTRERNESLAAEGRLQKVQADQARTQELNGQTRLIVARQNLERSIDSLKNLLGLPVDLQVTYEIKDLDGLQALVEEAFDVPEEVALRAGLRGRYDFRNSVDGVEDAHRRVELAENQLLPDLTLNLSARPVSKAVKPLKYNFRDGTYSAGADLDLGLDRDLESISLRASMLDLDRALRDQEAAAEGVKLEIRNALRQLFRTRETHQIARAAVEVAQQRVAMTTELLELGRGTTRDFLESQDALIQSQNGLVDALVEYRIAFLELFRDTGALVVAPGGLDHETSRSLLVGG